MAKKIDLRSPKVREQKRQVATYGTQTPLSSTAVERGSTRWLDGSNVSIEGLLSVSGTATVGGTLSVTGTLNASGAINLSGSTGITGPLNVTGTTTIGGNTSITGELVVTGPTTLDGDTEIGGLLDITGKTTIKNDLELLAGGLFKAGVTKIEPNGKATFGDFTIDPASTKLIEAPGGWLFSNGPDNLGLASSSSSSLQLSSVYAELNFKGTVIRAEQGLINLNATQTSVNGNLVVTGTAKVNGRADMDGPAWLNGAQVMMPALPTISSPPNLHSSASGRIYKSTWAPA